MNSASFSIQSRKIGAPEATYVVAELSANHNGSFQRAAEIVHAAKECGADAVKLQTYTADTLTIPSDDDRFRIKSGSLWSGRTLYGLYEEAHTPWEWQPELKNLADRLGLHLFSSPFDPTSVDFLERMGVPAYKIASSEIVDIPLIQHAARTSKPLIISTGMATLGEIEEALEAARSAGASEIALLKCTSAYPAPYAGMNLRTIRHMAETFHVPVGISDHSLGIAVPIAAVALGAAIVEKHLTLRRTDGGPDAAFSLEPEEFRSMVQAIRAAEQSKTKVEPFGGLFL
jgi:N-acetylneuraminate synthase